MDMTLEEMDCCPSAGAWCHSRGAEAHLQPLLMSCRSAQQRLENLLLRALLADAQHAWQRPGARSKIPYRGFFLDMYHDRSEGWYASKIQLVGKQPTSMRWFLRILRMHMSAWVAGTPLSSGRGRFMLPCRCRVPSLSQFALLPDPRCSRQAPLGTRHTWSRSEGGTAVHMDAAARACMHGPAR